MSVSRLRSCWTGRTSHSTNTEHKGASATASWGYRWLRANPGENKQDQLLCRGHPDSLFPEQQNQWIPCFKFRTLLEQLSRYPTWALCSQILTSSNEQARQDWRKKAHHSLPSNRSPGWDVAALSSVPPCWNRVDSMPSLATNLWEAEERLRKENAKERFCICSEISCQNPAIPPSLYNKPWTACRSCQMTHSKRKQNYSGTSSHKATAFTLRTEIGPASSIIKTPLGHSAEVQASGQCASISLNGFCSPAYYRTQRSPSMPGVYEQI